MRRHQHTAANVSDFAVSTLIPREAGCDAPTKGAADIPAPFQPSSRARRDATTRDVAPCCAADVSTLIPREAGCDDPCIDTERRR